MGITRWILKVIDKHSEYVMLIPFPLQQWFHESASMSPYTYIVLSVIFTLSVVFYLHCL